MHVMISEDRSFPSAKRVEGHWNRNRHIDPDHPGFDLFNEYPGSRTVTSVNRGAVSVLMLIDEFKRFTCIVDSHHTEDWSENLLPINPHGRPDIVKKTAPQKESLFGTRQGQVTAVHHQGGPFSRPQVDIGNDSIEMRLRDQRTHFHSLQIARSDFQRLDARNEFFDQAIA